MWGKLGRPRGEIRKFYGMQQLSEMSLCEKIIETVSTETIILRGEHGTLFFGDGEQ